jgi:hypothetical protein
LIKLASNKYTLSNQPQFESSSEFSPPLLLFFFCCTSFLFLSRSSFLLSVSAFFSSFFLRTSSLLSRSFDRSSFFLFSSASSSFSSLNFARYSRVVTSCPDVSIFFFLVVTLFRLGISRPEHDVSEDRGPMGGSDGGTNALERIDDGVEDDDDDNDAGDE